MQFSHVPDGRGKDAGSVRTGGAWRILVPYRTSDMLTFLGGHRVTFEAVGVWLAQVPGALELRHALSALVVRGRPRLAQGLSNDSGRKRVCFSLGYKQSVTHENSFFGGDIAGLFTVPGSLRHMTYPLRERKFPH